MAKEYPLGRIPSPYDPRDYNLKNFIPRGAFEEEVIEEKAWEYPQDHDPLNQGDTPHCVGFSMAGWGINFPIHIEYTNEDGHKFYYLCKQEDGEPYRENGSSIRSAAKVLTNLRKIEGYAFAPDLATLKWWLLNRGAMIVGTIWTRGMFEPDENNVIHPTGDIVGGHAYILNEWRKDGYIGIQNSWGKEWGTNGKAYISSMDFERLMKFDGEVLAAVELPIPDPEPPPVPEPEPEGKGCLTGLLDLVKNIFR